MFLVSQGLFLCQIRVKVGFISDLIKTWISETASQEVQWSPNLLLIPKTTLACPGDSELLSSQTCINTCICRKLHYGTGKHKSLLHTEVQPCRHRCACWERVDSCMQLTKAFNIQLFLLPQHHMYLSSSSPSLSYFILKPSHWPLPHRAQTEELSFTYSYFQDLCEHGSCNGFFTGGEFHTLRWQHMHTSWTVPLPELAAFANSSHAAIMLPSPLLGQHVWCCCSHKPHALRILAKPHLC